MVVVSCFPYSSLFLHVGVGVCAFEEVVTFSNLHVCFAREKIFTIQASLGKEPAGRIHKGTGRASGWGGGGGGGRAAGGVTGSALQSNRTTTWAAWSGETASPVTWLGMTHGCAYTVRQVG